MQRPLDPLNFKQNTYERPVQDWICGRAAEGHPCPLGPDQRGGCRATGECQPARKGDRWACTRLDARGGKCEEGPRPDGACCHPIPPCQPVRSLRRMRGITVLLVVALTIGGLFYFLGGGWRDRWLNPGELSAVHGTSSGHGTVAANCAECHSTRLGNGMALSAGFSHNRQLADSQLCLKCHSLGDTPLLPHAVAATVLAELTRKAHTTPNSGDAPAALKISRAIGGIDPHGGEIACATCHREHHGREASLTRLADAQCQVCHAVQFSSFTQGHPPFTKYPYQRRTRTFFDHNKHLDEHFTKEKERAPASCQSCHMADAAGRKMLVKDFQETCAACHAGQIKGEGMEFKGIAFFSIPELDVETLEAKGHRIGEWPRADGKLTPFMELLLGGDPELRASLDKLRGVKLEDLGEAGPEQLDAAEKLAWGVKSLLFDLTTGGHDLLLKRLGAEASAGRNRMSSELTGRMSPAAVLTAQQEWMPRLLSEVPDYRKGIKPPQAPKPVPAPPVPAKKPAAGDDSILDSGDLLILPKTPAPPAKPPAPANDDLSLLGGADDLSKAPAPPVKNKTPSGENGDLLSSAPEPASPKTAPAEKTPGAEIKPAEDWVASGGWYRPSQSYTLFYRPVGHADSFLVAWLNTTSGITTGESAGIARETFRKRASPEAPGLCTKCHTVDEQGGAMRVNWLPAHPEPHAHPFTVFKHTAHFSLLSDRGCQTCHQRDPASEYAKFFAATDGALPMDPSRFASNFAPLSQAICAECHKPQIAGENCLLCHRYHTGTFAPKVQEGSGSHAPSALSAVE